MKVHIDHDICEGQEKCVLTAPEVFEFHEDEDQSFVKLDEVPLNLRPRVDEAIRLCPRQAISWIGERLDQ